MKQTETVTMLVIRGREHARAERAIEQRRKTRQVQKHDTPERVSDKYTTWLILDTISDESNTCWLIGWMSCPGMEESKHAPPPTEQRDEVQMKLGAR